MRRLYPVVLVALLAVLYVVLLFGSLGDRLGLLLVAAIALYIVDDLLARCESVQVVRRLRQIGADTMWRAFYRQVLVTVFLIRSGHLSRAAVVVVVVAVVGQHLVLSLKTGVSLVVQRRRMRRVETRNLPVPNSELPRALPEWLAEPNGRLQMHTELLFLAGLAWAFFSDSYAPVPWAAALMVLGALAVPVAMLPQVRALLALADDQTRLEAAQHAVRALEPVAILYFSGSLNAVYQVNMWFETMERLNRPVLVLLRERRYLDRLPDTTVPVMCLPYTSDVMNFDFTGARIALYVANVGRNIHLLRVPTLKSAFIGHGDSDKVASFNPYAKVYDEVWVAGEAGRERYARAQVGIRPDEIVVVGRPQLDGLQESVARPEGAPFTVLYAPTWEGWIDDVHASSLLPMGREIVRVLLAEPGVRVVFKPHPLTGTVQLEAARVQNEICTMIAAAGPEHVVVLAEEKTLYECFDDSDALISDISSVVSDYLRSEKPYFVTNGANIAEHEFRDEYPSAGAAYLIGADADGLRAGLADARGPDSQRLHRREVRRYLLGDPEVESIVLFAKAVDDLAARAAAQLPNRPADDDDMRLAQHDAAVLDSNEDAAEPADR